MKNSRICVAVVFAITEDDLRNLGRVKTKMPVSKLCVVLSYIIVACNVCFVLAIQCATIWSRSEVSTENKQVIIFVCNIKRIIRVYLA